MIRRAAKIVAVVGPLAFVLSACQAPTAYHWGHYEDLVYVSYADPGKLSLEQQAQTMESDLLEAQGKQKPVPPGFHAHLGYLYAQLGRSTDAKAQFEVEKTKFPESTVLMDRLIANLSRK